MPLAPTIAVRLRGAILACVAMALAAPAPAAEGPYAWRDVPRVIAFADVHGAYSELTSLLQSAGVIDANGRWKAGTTHLVSLGDLLDRGPDSRRVMDLLMRLEQEAEAAGGRVHTVLGNHELMNLTGELEYVSAAEFAAYRDLETPAMRDAAFARLQASGRYAQMEPSEARATFEVRFAAGYFGHRAAFAPDGRYGKWLLARPVLVRIDDAVFVHGGLPPMVAATNLEALNAELRADVRTYVHAYTRLVAAGLLDVDTPFAKRSNLARSRLESMSPAAERESLATAIAGLERSGASPVHDPRGPLWYRGTALCNPLLETDVAAGALRTLQAKRVSVGHTVTPSARIVTRLEGRALLLDTGMLRSVYRGRSSALVIERGTRSALYAGEPGASEVQPAGRRVGARAGNMDDDTLESFLAEAEIVAAETHGPDSQLLTLRRGPITLRGVFESAEGWEREIAAYRLDRLIGLEMIPVTVARVHQGRRGMLQFRPADEPLGALEARGVQTQGWCPLAPQVALAATFDALIDHQGRQPAHMRLAADEGMLHLTGHAGAFTRSRTLASRAKELALPDALLERLGSLTREQLARELGPWLSAAEVSALLVRRDRLVRLRTRRTAADAPSSRQEAP